MRLIVKELKLSIQEIAKVVQRKRLLFYIFMMILLEVQVHRVIKQIIAQISVRVIINLFVGLIKLLTLTLVKQNVKDVTRIHMENVEVGS